MIAEDYCSYEVAKLLKEKGFDWPCRAYITLDEEGPCNLIKVNDVCKEDLLDLQYLCPTHQMAMAWLREVHNLFIQITIDFSDGAYPMYNSTAINLETCEKTIITGYDRYSYKEAITTALKYSLENLI